MKTDITREELVADIRKKYQLEKKENAYHFTKEEMMIISEFITGEYCPWTSQDHYFSNYLQEYGYTTQLTVDTHPTTKNLIWLVDIYNEIQKIEEELNSAEDYLDINSSDSYDLIKLIQKLIDSEKIESLNLEAKTLTVKFK